MSDITGELDVLLSKCFPVTADDFLEWVESSSDYDGGVHKATVVEEALHVFRQPTLMRENAGKSCAVIAQLLRLQNSSHHCHLSEKEATSIFVGLTQSFASDDASLRRLVYLIIKDIAGRCDPDLVVVVISCLIEDMTCSVDHFQANALRVLVRIVQDKEFVSKTIDRYMRHAIVHSSRRVSTSALVSATHWFNKSPDFANVVGGWSNEIERATHSRYSMVRFHALHLLLQIKSSDQFAAATLIHQHSQLETPPLARVVLIRYAAKLLEDESARSRVADNQKENVGSLLLSKQARKLLEASLRHDSEMVVFEAARAICSLPTVAAEEMDAAISALKVLLFSRKPLVRVASLKLVAKLRGEEEFVMAVLDDDSHRLGFLPETDFKAPSDGLSKQPLLEPLLRRIR